LQVKPGQVHAEEPFRGCKQYQIVRIKQTVDHAASNSDTLVDWAVTVYPIHIGYDVNVYDIVASYRL